MKTWSFSGDKIKAAAWLLWDSRPVVHGPRNLTQFRQQLARVSRTPRKKGIATTNLKHLWVFYGQSMCPSNFSTGFVNARGLIHGWISTYSWDKEMVTCLLLMYWASQGKGQVALSCVTAMFSVSSLDLSLPLVDLYFICIHRIRLISMF